MGNRRRDPGNKRRELHLLLQQGGSTTEWYAKLFNTGREAEKHARSCEAASYQTTVPVRLPTALTAALLASPDAEAEFLAALETAVQDAVEIA